VNLMPLTLKAVMQLIRTLVDAVISCLVSRQQGGVAVVVAIGLMLGLTMEAVAAARLKKTVHQYALTSANDFPQRDPQDWRLLGSNDGGKTWITVDTRKREVFTERHQRRVFKLSKPATFDTFRLQIDLVRDPKVANSVQLAEIELLGETEADLDPLPIF